MPELAGPTAQWASPGRVGAADELVSKHHITRYLRLHAAAFHPWTPRLQ